MVCVCLRRIQILVFLRKSESVLIAYPEGLTRCPLSPLALYSHCTLSLLKSQPRSLPASRIVPGQKHTLVMILTCCPAKWGWHHTLLVHFNFMTTSLKWSLNALGKHTSMHCLATQISLPIFQPVSSQPLLSPGTSNTSLPSSGIHCGYWRDRQRNSADLKGISRVPLSHSPLFLSHPFLCCLLGHSH